ncbi:ADAMTS-like protein 5 [Larimichthys crocea]|uniref:Uncharacterized protein n=1 Tax=Larimichthys crocea TaxID=215358 RepID=A0ACD3R4B1_LARCR|nr:ADAMTS-like protein 5 [Larimichthys crocea]
MQCAAFNDRPLVAGNSFKWTTFHGGSNPCELSCLALGHNFYYNFGRVLDGTACDKEPGAVCVNGHCLLSGEVNSMLCVRARVQPSVSITALLNTQSRVLLPHPACPLLTSLTLTQMGMVGKTRL